MTHLMSREIRLISRPNGLPSATNFTLSQTELGPLQDQQVLVGTFSCRWIRICAVA